jgi:hypothetical protein
MQNLNHRDDQHIVQDRHSCPALARFEEDKRRISRNPKPWVIFFCTVLEFGNTFQPYFPWKIFEGVPGGRYR